MRLVAFALVAVLAAPDGASAAESATGFTVEQAKTAVAEHVERNLREGGGVYRLQEGAGGKTHELEFVHVGVVSASKLWSTHDPERRPEGAFLACASFHPVGAPKEKLYDVDMRVETRDGRLVVTDVWIHREKQLVRGEWVWREWPGSAGAAARR